MQQCLVRVWRAHALAPAKPRRELTLELTLDCDLLGVTDSTVSRAQNAPRLTAGGAALAHLRVPERCANTVLVVKKTDFRELQRGVPMGDQDFIVGPGQLNGRFRLTRGPTSSVALLHSLYWGPNDPSEHLLVLPRAERVPPGAEASVEAPAILVVGEGAVEVLPGETVLPDSEAETFDPPRSFKLPDTGVSKAAIARLDEIENPELPSMLRIADREEAFEAERLSEVGAWVLGRVKHHYAFVPALVGEQQARLVLFYAQEDGSTRALVSDSHVATWLERIDAALTAADYPLGAPVASVRPSAALPGDETPSLPDDPRVAARVLANVKAFGSVKTRSADFAEELMKAKYAAEGGLGLFILGETGTGKEYLAQAVHDASPRRAGPFLAVNCAAVPDGLIESELFGHKKGAFSGAESDRQGAFATADGGTLLLDELGDAPLRVQVALLRVLETRSVRPVGSDRERPVDVRVIAATRMNIARLMREEKLRDDLYYRLAEQTITLPPLRERVCDVRLIAAEILGDMGKGKGLSPDALSALERYRWPGNVRELRNALRRAVVIAGDATLLAARHFPNLNDVHADFGDEATPFDFPDLVRGVAMLAWKEQQLSAASVRSKYEQRALQRSALLYLSTLHTRSEFPSQLVLDWTRLFGAKWALSENGRGLREVLRVLAVPPTDRRAGEWVVWKVKTWTLGR